MISFLLCLLECFLMNPVASSGGIKCQDLCQSTQTYQNTQTGFRKPAALPGVKQTKHKWDQSLLSKHFTRIAKILIQATCFPGVKKGFHISKKDGRICKSNFVLIKLLGFFFSANPINFMLRTLSRVLSSNSKTHRTSNKAHSAPQHHLEKPPCSSQDERPQFVEDGKRPGFQKEWRLKESSSNLRCCWSLPLVVWS